MTKPLSLPIITNQPDGRPKRTAIMTRQLTEVEEGIRRGIEQVKPLVNPNINPRAKYHLDTTKLAWHKDRVEVWREGYEVAKTGSPWPEANRVAPITIDMALTQKCSMACTFCYAGLQQNPADPMSWECLEGLLDDCITIGHKPGEGVRAISLVSDGESSESKYFARFIHEGKKRGIDMAVGSNGLKLKKEEIPGLVRDLTYFRFNFNAGDLDANAEIMGTTVERVEKVLENVQEMIRVKKETGSNITIGLQQVLLPQYADQVIPLALRARDLGVDYLVIKHCSDDERGSLGVDYNWYRGELAQELLKTAEGLSTETTSIQAKWSKLQTGRDRKYAKCFGTPLMLQMSGSGIVAPCGSFFHGDYERYHMGKLMGKRFKEIWGSDQYWNIMSHLGSDQFDPRKQCATLCLQDKVNERLYDLVEHGTPLPDVSGSVRPAHINFI